MKNSCLAIVFTIFCSNFLFAQNKIFTTYNDTIMLQHDAQNLLQTFTKDVKKINPDILFDIKCKINTTPYMIYYDGSGMVNLPYWDDVIPPLKTFLTQVSGSEEKGKDVFGLFFNGFYIPHELGHALEHKVGSNIENGYESEYFANVVAMLWWRKQGKETELKKCYEYVQDILNKLPNPVPEGQSESQYFKENYRAATQNPTVYGYLQFSQFKKIYEDKTLPNFDAFVSDFIKNIK